MIFILLTFLAAFLLEGIGSVISIYGLMAIFGINYFIIFLAVSFDFAKIITVSLLYKEWGELNKPIKFYLTLASCVLVLITSTGAAGYLSAEFQKAILPTLAIDIKVKAIEEEKVKLEKRKIEIDNQITNLPSDMVKGRTKLIANFKTELERTNNRIVELDQEVPKLKIEAVDKTSHAGPITFIAKIFKITAESAMSYLIGLIVLVFDPLAVALILAGNYLVEKRRIRNEITDDVPVLPFTMEQINIYEDIFEDNSDLFSDEVDPIEEIVDKEPEEIIEEIIEDTTEELYAEIIEKEYEQEEPVDDIIEDVVPEEIIDVPEEIIDIIPEEPIIEEIEAAIPEDEEFIDLDIYKDDISIEELTPEEIDQEALEVEAEYQRKYDDEVLGYTKTPIPLEKTFTPVLNKVTVTSEPSLFKSSLHDVPGDNAQVTFDF